MGLEYARGSFFADEVLEPQLGAAIVTVANSARWVSEILVREVVIEEQNAWKFENPDTVLSQASDGIRDILKGSILFDRSIWKPPEVTRRSRFQWAAMPT